MTGGTDKRPTADAADMAECSLCDGTGTIRAVPSPMVCPACGGSGEAADDEADLIEAPQGLPRFDGEFAGAPVEKMLEDHVDVNWSRFRELFWQAASITFRPLSEEALTKAAGIPVWTSGVKSCKVVVEFEAQYIYRPSFALELPDAETVAACFGEGAAVETVTQYHDIATVERVSYELGVVVWEPPGSVVKPDNSAAAGIPSMTAIGTGGGGGQTLTGNARRRGRPPSEVPEPQRGRVPGVRRRRRAAVRPRRHPEVPGVPARVQPVGPPRPRVLPLPRHVARHRRPQHRADVLSADNRRYRARPTVRPRAVAARPACPASDVQDGTPETAVLRRPAYAATPACPTDRSEQRDVPARPATSRTALLRPPSCGGLPEQRRRFASLQGWRA